MTASELTPGSRTTSTSNTAYTPRNRSGGPQDYNNMIKSPNGGFSAGMANSYGGRSGGSTSPTPGHKGVGPNFTSESYSSRALS
eukprot:CAMPEP_0115011854 /NCGR_PEP_ID=MMETSP0216-20121206/24330_1 /TAXON_ID=223996 /ORGANISM="Protocruzia adherens, Strain Boccale" /LENGTH=83 /DNA_ID=CAMNT_0002380681 /DNA_START=222 /DNA_END=470 /DNA_ORIENTATION=+